MSRTLASAVLALAPLWFTLAVQPVLRHALNQDISRAAQILDQGYTWAMNRPGSLVGGQPVAVQSWALSDKGLRLRQLSDSGYVPLNFHGMRLPAAKLTRLRIDLNTASPGRLLFFHRAQLDGPAAKSRAVPVQQGRQQLELDATRLAWTVQGSPVPWGHQDGALATLRIHPTGTLAELEIFSVSVLPGTDAGTTAATGAAASSPKLDRADESAQLGDKGFSSWSAAAFRRQLNTFRDQPRLWASTPLTHSWLPGLAVYLVLAAALLLAVARHRWRPAAAIALLTVSIAWVFSQPSWQPAGVAACIAALLLCLLVRYRHQAAAAAPLGGAPATAGGSAGDLLRLLAAVSVLLAIVLLTHDRSDPWSLSLPRWLSYLAWVAVQQWLLCALLFPLARMAGAGVPAAIGIAAAVFGWSHMPNLELMVMTWLLALGCLWHYSRHRQLLAPMALHGLAGSVLLAVTPTPMLYSASAGPGFWF